MDMLDAGSMKVTPDMMEPYAQLLVNAIGPDLPGWPCTVIRRLAYFYRAVEPFYHPSSKTRCMPLVISFTNKLLDSLVIRLRNEILRPKYWDKLIGLPPVDFVLSVDQVDQLVNLLASVVLDNTLFCHMQDVKILSDLITSSGLLARLRPKAILPRLVELLEDGRNRPETPLRFIRPLQALIPAMRCFGFTDFALYLHDNACGIDIQPSDADSGSVKCPELDTEIDQQDLDGEFSDRSENRPTDSSNDSLVSLGERADQKVDTGDKTSGNRRLHLSALVYPKARTLIVRVLNCLLEALDFNLPDRLALAICCLSRLFSSVAVHDVSDLLGDGAADGLTCEVMESSAEVEDTVVRVYERVLQALYSLNDRSTVTSASQLASTNKATAVLTGRQRFRHQYAQPDGPPRSDSEVAYISALTDFPVIMAISAGPNPRLRCRLLRQLTDAVFNGTQWEPDIARQFAFQFHWLAVKSLATGQSPSSSVGAELTKEQGGWITINGNTVDCTDDTPMFALGLLWPRFMACYRECFKEGSIVYRGRAEPRLLALLYILTGPLSAFNPSRLVDDKFQELYLLPLVDILAHILHLSTGVSVIIDSGASGLLGCEAPPQTDAEGCPAMAEAAGSLLAILLHRLISYSVKLENINLMQTSSTCSPVSDFFTSPGWTPFITTSDLLELSSEVGESHSVGQSKTLRPLWFIPTDETKRMAGHLTLKFLTPVLTKLDEIARDLRSVTKKAKQTCPTSSTLPNDQWRGFQPNIPFTSQRDQLTALLIWANHITAGLSETLAPRTLNGSSTANAHIAAGPTKLNVEFFHCSLSINKGVVMPLRELVFQVGLQLMESIAEVFSLCDDSLELAQPIASASTKPDKVTKVIPNNLSSLLLTGGQLDSLISLTEGAALNLSCTTGRSSLLRCVGGPSGICSPVNKPQANAAVFPAAGLLLVPSISASSGIPKRVAEFLFNASPDTDKTCVHNEASILTGDCLKAVHIRPVSVGVTGRHILALLGRSQQRFMQLLRHRLRFPLTEASTWSNGDRPTVDSPCIVMTPDTNRLISAMSVLATASKRRDICRYAATSLGGYSWRIAPKVLLQVVNRLLDRFENAAADVAKEYQSVHPSLANSLGWDGVYKLIHHRRTTSVSALQTIICRQRSGRSRDLLFRTDVSVLTRLLKVFIDSPSNDMIIQTSGMKVGRATEDQQRCCQNLDEQLRHQILDLMHKLVPRMTKCVTCWVGDRNSLPKGSWLTRVYSDANNLLRQFNEIKVETASTTLANKTSDLVTQRSRVFRQLVDFFADKYFCRLDDNKALIPSIMGVNKEISGFHQAFLFDMVPFMLNQPLIHPRLADQSTPMAPFPSIAHPPSMLTAALHMIMTGQAELAYSACYYLGNAIFAFGIYPRPVSLVKIDSATFVREYAGCEFVRHGCPIPGPRADNVPMFFDENLKVLDNEAAYQRHHHIPTLVAGYIYYPPQMFIKNPHQKHVFPEFDTATGEVDRNNNEWLQHLDGRVAPEDLEIMREFLRQAANHLAGLRVETKQFWLTLADRLMRLYRLPSEINIFPLKSFLTVVAEAFGPDPLIHHLETFLTALLPIEPDTAELDSAYDGVAAVAGTCWLIKALQGIFIGVTKWPRVWRHYFFTRLLPRVLVRAELLALTLRSGQLMTLYSDQIHQLLLPYLYPRLPFVGSYTGLGKSPTADLPTPSAQRENEDDKELDQLLAAVSDEKPRVKSKIGPTQAGGSLHRLPCIWGIVFPWLLALEDTDPQCLHPVWEFIQAGLSDTHRAVASEGDSGNTGCPHSSTNTASLPNLSKYGQLEDACPLCQLQHCIPLDHRLVFCVRLASLFITHLCWVGNRLYPRLAQLLPPEKKGVACSAPWFRLASSNSFWLRSLAALLAIYHTALPGLNLTRSSSVPLQSLVYPNGDGNLGPARLHTIDSCDVEQGIELQSTQLPSPNVLGIEFLWQTFLPHLVRDTVSALRLKGREPSAASKAFLVGVDEDSPNWPEPSNSQDMSTESCSDRSSPECFDSELAQHLRHIELIPLANRLRCMYVCLPNLLIYGLPVTDRSRSSVNSETKDVLLVCLQLAPLLADFCAIGDFYQTVSNSLRLKATFSPSLFPRTANRTGSPEDAYLDGLESGVDYLLVRLSVLTVAGQASPAVGIEAIIHLSEIFLTHPSWKSRAVGLLLLRNLIFVNLSALWEVSLNADTMVKLTVKLRDSVTRLLDDVWLEVSQSAMRTLAAFIQVGHLQYDTSWVTDLIGLANCPYPRRNCLATKEMTSTERSQTASSIRRRHSGVLGLAAFVTAYPHKTPDFLPAIIAELARHANDPQPIANTVSVTLNEYSRSHQDVWHEQRTKFTDDQLEEYQSVVSAVSYYT